MFSEWAGEHAGAARAAVPPGGRATTLRARGAGGAAAGVSAKSGATEGGPEECGEGEGEDWSPAEATAELEAQPPEQPACYDTTGWIQGKRRKEGAETGMWRRLGVSGVEMKMFALMFLNVFQSPRCPTTAALAAWMEAARCTSTSRLYSPPFSRTASTSPPTTTSTSCSLCRGRTQTALCTAPATPPTLASVPASTTASTPCWARLTANTLRTVTRTQTTVTATAAPNLWMTPSTPSAAGSPHSHRRPTTVSSSHNPSLNLILNWDSVGSFCNEVSEQHTKTCSHIDHLYIQVRSFPKVFFFFFFVILLLADFSPSLDRRRAGPWRSEVTGLYEDDYSSSPSLTPLLPPQAYLSLEGQNGEEAGEENIVYLWKSLPRKDQCKLPDIKLDRQWYISVAFYVFVCVPVAPIVMWWLHIELRTECKGSSCRAEVSTDTVCVPSSVYVAAMNHFSSCVMKPSCLLAEKFFINRLLYLYSPCFCF